MPKTKKSPQKKSTPANTSQKVKKSDLSGAQDGWRKRAILPFKKLRSWRRSLRPATPHRSFRRTYRRDYTRSLVMPGYVAFTIEVWRTLWRHRSAFLWLILLYSVLSGFLVGLASQSTYDQLSQLMREAGGDIAGGDISGVGEAASLLLVGLSGGLNPDMGEGQQIIGGLLGLLIWLTTVWLLRAFLAGHKPRLRDGLYNAGAPIVPTMLLALFVIVQLVPAAIAAIGISAAMPTELVSEGVEAMLFWVVVTLLVVLSLYWITSTVIALVVVTLPGMYPLHALKTANELVVGRRLRVVLRMAWLLVVTLLIWGVVMIPIIIFDSWLKESLPAISWLPIVPYSLLVMSSGSVVWVASYIYLFYRKVVDDDAAPA